MKLWTSLLVFLVVTVTAAKEGFDDYKNKTEVPEPLFVDLVRSLSAEYGEWEVNSLFYSMHGNFQQLRWAPEIEFVLKSGTAVEFELPMEGGDLAYYKTAFQQRVFENQSGTHMQGLQLIYESDPKFLHSDVTLYYILAHRFSHTLSTIGLMGVRSILESYQGLEVALNQSFFYNYNRHIDLGLEFNYSSGTVFDRFFQVIPQLHLAFPEGGKIQFGFGMRRELDQYYPISTFRLIWELNK